MRKDRSSAGLGETSPVIIRPGTVLGGKYRLLRPLGHGAMGEVWAAQHETLEEVVAMKLLAPRDDEDFETPTAAERTRARFQFEARIAARLSRKTRHIVQVIDHGHEGELDFLVMELLEGETLEQLMRREQPLRPEVLVDIVNQIARALSVAHEEGVAHRDLKPANILLTMNEEGHRIAKLLDFGIARVLPRHRVRAPYQTAQGVVVGTPAYMSPEQARGAMSLDHQCDLWALATVAYEALVGAMPVESDNVTELLMKLCRGVLVPIGHRNPALARLESFFARAFHESMGMRFASAVELAAALEVALGPSPATASTSSSPVAETLARAPRRARLTWRHASLVMLGALMAGELVWLSSAAVARPPPSMAASDVAMEAPPTSLEPTSSAEQLTPLPSLTPLSTALATALTSVAPLAPSRTPSPLSAPSTSRSTAAPRTTTEKPSSPPSGSSQRHRSEIL